MKNGIRYFDLRCGWDNTTQAWRTFHLIDGNNIELLLRNITAFLNDHPKEFVVVEASHFDGDPDTGDVTELEHMILDIFGDLLIE
mmetsp:Transcript_30669/g.5531  ORF Transcript_30669/g.5531 Transcript_30669/m.5531 type:complete len:85 (+) Transcript_30669:282-536(+)